MVVERVREGRYREREREKERGREKERKRIGQRLPGNTEGGIRVPRGA